MCCIYLIEIHLVYRKLTCTLYDSSVKIFKDIDDNVRQFEYANIIDSLSYNIDCTGSYIAYVIGLLHRFSNKPSIKY